VVGDAVIFTWLNVFTNDQSRDVEVLNRNKVCAKYTSIVVRNYDENRVIPVR
ncbi:hypothetical protein D037_3792B, partial [Vibrio parahaemolyticus IDH02640]